MDVIKHYDMLINENNDSFRDPPVLQEYMNRWDGQIFIDSMKLDRTKTVLEIGVGTGRIASKVAPQCLSFFGIDISPKTVDRAEENLAEHENITLICDDFLRYEFNETFDIVYSSLTMMHFEDKQKVVSKVDLLLKNNGIFCLSIDKNQSEYIDMGNRKIRVYPDTPENIILIINKTSMNVSELIETENAYLIICTKTA